MKQQRQLKESHFLIGPRQRAHARAVLFDCFRFMPFHNFPRHCVRLLENGNFTSGMGNQPHS